jgi:hypothetical protein
MNTKEWTKPLPNGFEILVRIVTERGALVKFAVVLISNEEEITRYDNAHSTPHRDILGRKKPFIKKQWCENMTLTQALVYGINDLATNYEKYRDFYNAH